jgi:Xaa-Pro aminopeptidase
MTSPTSQSLPFQPEKLDRLLDEAGIDILIVNSKHNLAYLLDRHRHHFFEFMDAIGVSRYLPLLVYVKGRLDYAAYIANRNEKDSIANRAAEARPLWPQAVRPVSSGTLDAMAAAIEHLKEIGGTGRRIGIETAFLPWDAGRQLQDQFPQHQLRNATGALERLRAVKSERELATLRQASERVVDAMIAVMTGTRPGTSKRQILDALRLEETKRGLVFDYGLVTVGRGLNRAPSDEPWLDGDILSLDSGGNLEGYIGDLCRMAIMGEPDAQARDLLAEVRAIQDAARAPIRAGLSGADIYVAAQAALAATASKASISKASIHFVAHGMGLVSHEAPRLTATGPIPYPADDAERPLEAGMVLSVETTLIHPQRGFIKLEDTVAVTDEGHTGFGDRGRDWTRGNPRPA